VQLPEGGQVALLAPYSPPAEDGSVRLWIAALRLPDDFELYLNRYGYPIRYNYVHDAWPVSYYQTVYANEMGSAEMPSAGRAFTSRLVTRLVARGVQIAPVLLHTGVASLEAHEPPYAEFYRVSPESAGLLNRAREEGRRIIAVGTTAVRAVETVTGKDGVTHAGQGWTDLVITPERGIWGVDGLLTGFHEPEATHLAMLEALTGRQHLAIIYPEALRQKYLWHEFGDLHLILP
jgi:S-adenosylmethionine:tRNA ribosyltransferase-isomerase